jgi:NADPH:quinone reductase-like Zn-dependent oxidoreductase
MTTTDNHPGPATQTASKTMHAIVHEGFGTPDRSLAYRAVESPDISEDEVLVRVHAAGAAIGDWLTTMGLPYIARPQYGLRKPRHRVGGYEVAGVVETVGANVTEFAPGEEVFGWGNGSFAEFVALPAGQLVAKPSNVTLEQAAAVPISGLAAIEALRDTGRLQPGQHVLILGASGAVGTFAVQIAKALGAEVTGVGSTRNIDLIRAVGADHVIDYTREDATDGSRRYDLVLDLAGNRSLSDLRRALTPQGTLVIVGGSGGPWSMGFGRTIRAAVVSPFIRQHLRPFISKPSKENLIALRELIEAGAVNPVIDRTFPLSATADALQYLAERHTQGKSVITI